MRPSPVAEAQVKHRPQDGKRSLYDPEIIERVITGLAEGIPLRELCRQEGMPARRTVDDWREADPELSARIARAREKGFDAIAEDSLEIADDGRNDWVERQKDDGSTYIDYNGDHVQRSKLRVDTRLKLLAKWDPKRYGDKQQLEHSGSIGATPTDPEQVAQQFITMGTQYPTLNPLIRKMAEDILAKLPEIT